MQSGKHLLVPSFLSLTRSRLQVGYLDDHQIDGFGKDGAVIAAAQATPVRQKVA
jgi:hypothetical protein